MRKFIAHVAVGWAAISVLGCGAARLDGSTLAGKAAVLDEVNRLLDAGECNKAVELIEGVYNSKYVDNEVRMARAASHACLAGIESFVQLLTSVGSANFGSSAGEGSFLFRTASQAFYKAGAFYGDRSRAAENANFALMATVKPGVSVERAYQVSPETFNPGSLRAADRTTDASFYQVFVSLAWMGALQNRYSSPNIANWKKGAVLGFSVINPNGWAVATANQGDGCAYSSALLNFLDGIDQSLTLMPTSVQAALQNVTNLSALLGAACEAGCRGTGTVNSGCTFPAGSCASCPIELRNPTSCTGLVDNKASCAAAGIADFINNSTAAGWVGP